VSKPSITLTFASQRAKEYFLGQLCDGWGENYVSINWPEDVDLCDAETAQIKVFDLDSDNGEYIE